MSGFTPCVPTLGSQFLLTDPQDILTYVVRQFCTMPRSVSNTFYSMTASLSDIITQFGGVESALSSPITETLTQVLDRIFFNNIGISVVVTVSNISDSDYSLYISVVIIYNGNSYSVNPSITVKNGTIITANDNVLPNTTAI